MQFRIADTFTDSLAKLTGDEQKAVKTAAFDLQMNPAHPGLKLHQVDRAKDKDFWSVRVSRDIRLIVYRTASSVLLCYVDHHDAAYQWAERRRLEQHPRTGAAQLVEIRETVREIQVPRYVEVDVPTSTQGVAAGRPAASRTAIFADASDDDRLGYGVPFESLDDVRTATEDTLLDLADHLPGEAADALLQLATGGAPDRPAPAVAGADPFASGRAAPLPGDGGRGGAGAGAGLPLGEVDGLPAPRPRATRRTRVHRSGACLGLGRHRQDHRGAPRGGASRAIGVFVRSQEQISTTGSFSRLKLTMSQS